MYVNSSIGECYLFMIFYRFNENSAIKNCARSEISKTILGVNKNRTHNLLTSSRSRNWLMDVTAKNLTWLQSHPLLTVICKNIDSSKHILKLINSKLALIT